MVENQAFLFIIFVIDGIIIGILFDIFRVLRKSFKTKDFVTNIEDIIFWILVGIIFFYSMYNYCDGELRLFMVIGIILGILMYMITISRFFISGSIMILKIIKKLFIIPINIVNNIFKKVYKIIIKPVINLVKKIILKIKIIIIQKFGNNIKNITKKCQKK